MATGGFGGLVYLNEAAICSYRDPLLGTRSVRAEHPVRICASRAKQGGSRPANEPVPIDPAWVMPQEVV